MQQLTASTLVPVISTARIAQWANLDIDRSHNA